MKKILLVILTIMLAVAEGVSSPAADNQPGVKAIVYYFHGNFRCSTCLKIERYSREAIETSFKDALASGRLEFHVVNIEEKGKEHYGKDYQLYTRSLIVSLVKDGKETKWINLDKIWQHVGHKKKFMDYVTSGVAGLLREAE